MADEQARESESEAIARREKVRRELATARREADAAKKR